jgi:cysteine desulfurase/selenocysteine lyase
MIFAMNNMDQARQFGQTRQDFPMLQKTVHGHPLVYLDSAATAQKPLCVIEAITDFYRTQYGTVHRAVYATAVQASEMYQKARQKVADFLHAHSVDEIVFTRGTTDAINLVAHSFGRVYIQPGDEILITEMEHHSNIVPWQMCANDRQAILKVIPFLDSGELDLEAFHTLLNERTKIVAITHVSNALGTINPVKEIIKEAHQWGSKVLVDGAQCAAHMPVDVSDLDVDFYVFSGHKVVGPTGIGILYGKLALLEEMPPYQGGGDMIETVTFAKTTYNVVPLKFEAGTPMIAEVIGLGVALDYLTQVGLDQIRLWEQTLLELVLPRILEVPGLTLFGQAPSRSAILTFAVDGVHPLDIATLLDLAGIAIRSGHLCVQPIMRHFGISAAARASFAFYNTKEELLYFIEMLKQVIAKLR